MYPISNYKTVRRGYTHGKPTSYSNFHLGADLIVPTGTPIYAPTNCKVTTGKGEEGGNTIYAVFDGLVMRCLHLSKFAKTGDVNRGDIIGYSGNTGKLTTGPHIHLDLSVAPFNLTRPKNEFIDPDKYDWEQFDNPILPPDTGTMCTPEDLALEGFKVAFKAVRNVKPEQNYIDEWKASGMLASQFVREKYYLPTINELEAKIQRYSEEIESLRQQVANNKAVDKLNRIKSIVEE